MNASSRFAISPRTSAAVRPAARTSPIRGSTMVPSGRTVTSPDRSVFFQTLTRNTSDGPSTNGCLRGSGSDA
jgi:hypothetical protein